MPPENIKTKTAEGLFWGGLSNVLQQLLNLGFGIFLARKLSVSDYGIIGMLTIFAALSNALQEGGFRSALTNRKNISPNDYNSVFWTSFLIGTTLYITLFFSLPWIADFFNTPELVPLGRFMFLGFLFCSLGTANNAYLFKNLKVKEMSKCTLTATVISGVTAVVLAFSDFTYWAIAAMNVVYIVVSTLMYKIYSPLKISFKIDFRPVKEMLPFSSKLLITTVFQILNDNFFMTLLGRFFTKIEVGFYSQAYKWSNLGTQTISLAIENVMQPVLAKTEQNSLLNVFNKLMQTTCFIAFPCMLGLGFIAPEFITVTITDKWAQSAEIMTILCVWGAFYPIGKLYQKQLLSSSKSGTLMFCVITNCLLQILTVVFTFKYGILTMALFYVVVNMLCILLLHYFVRKINGVKIKNLVINVLPFLISISAAIFLAWIVSGYFSNVYIRLLTKISVTVAGYFGILKLAKSEILEQSIRFLKSFLKRK
ncbi:MAG: lipopolysaccharide biosynthesis protein [Bacteroidales bacterium]|nr:lipopolysaccharide biosynthesis protein [Bacteroidales bacterium]